MQLLPKKRLKTGTLGHVIPRRGGTWFWANAYGGKWDKRRKGAERRPSGNYTPYYSETEQISRPVLLCLSPSNVYAYIAFHPNTLSVERPIFDLALLGSTVGYMFPTQSPVLVCRVRVTRRRPTASLAVPEPLRIPSFQS